MCSVAALGVTSAAVSGAGAVASTVLSVESRQQQIRAAEAQADRNAALSMLSAADAQRMGSAQASQIKLQASQTAAAQRAALAATGQHSTTDSRTFWTEYNAALDQDAVKASAAMRAWGFEQEAEGYRRQAEQIRKAGMLGTIGDVVTGVGGVAGAVGKKIKGFV